MAKVPPYIPHQTGYITQTGSDVKSAWNAATLSVVTGANTCTADAESGFQIGGVYPVKVTQGSSGSGVAKMTFAIDQDWGGAQSFNLGFRVSQNIPAAGCGSFYLYFYFTDGTFTSYKISQYQFAPSINHVVTISRFKPDGTIANFGGTDYFDTKKVRAVALGTDTTSVQANATYFWAALIGVDYKQKSNILLGLDGNYLGQKTIALPILQEFGLKATFYVQQYQLGQSGRFALADLDLIYSLGHAVAMHSYSKDANYTDTSAFPTVGLQAAVESEISGFKTWAAGRGYSRGANHYCAAITNPFDPSIGTQTNARMQAIIAAFQAQGVISYRMGIAGYQPYSNQINQLLSERPWDVFVNQFNSQSPGTANQDINSSTEAANQVQTTVRQGMTKMLYGHDFVQSGASGTTVTNRAVFYALCDEIARQIAMGKATNTTIDKVF